MAGKPLTKLPHSCGTREGLQVFLQDDGTLDGYCFSCGTYIENPYGENVKPEDIPRPRVKTEEEIREEIKEVSDFQTFPLNDRKLSKEAFEQYNVKMSVSEKDGTTPTAVYFPYTKNGKLSGYKVKTIGLRRNKMWTIGDVRDVDLFGWRQAIEAVENGSRKLIITEGEYDTIALSRIVLRYNDGKYPAPAICSIPHGAGAAAKDLERLKHSIKKYFDEKDIILCFDMDEPGRKAIEECMLVFPLAQTTELPSKDANDCLIEGRTKAAFNAVTFKTTTPKNSRIVFGRDIHEEAKEQAQWGELSWPWKHVNEVTRGIRYGETIYLGSGVKMGKSEVVNSLGAHFISEYDVPVLMAKPEEANKKTYKLVAGKMTGHVYHDPKIEFDEKSFESVKGKLSDNLMMLNLYQHLGWKTLKADIITAVNHGAKVVFVDPITNLTNGIDSGEANTILQEVAQELASMAKDYDIVIFIFCHLKSHDGNIDRDKREKDYREGKYIGLGNCPHEFGGDIYSSQFAGSRAMMRSCNYMFGLEGNKDPDLPEEVRHMRHLKLLEDREFGETGVFPLYWQRETTLFKEI